MRRVQYATIHQQNHKSNLRKPAVGGHFVADAHIARGHMICISLRIYDTYACACSRERSRSVAVGRGTHIYGARTRHRLHHVRNCSRARAQRTQPSQPSRP